MRKSKSFKIVLVFSIIFFALLVVLYSLEQGDLSLEDEFNSAYGVDVKKSGNVVDYVLVASEGNSIELFEGHKTRVWSYNNKVPGPTFRISLGDTLRVKFVNKLSTATTVHWHGLRIPNDMDGFPGISQEPVGTGETFVYEFTPKDAGTFWFHPHIRGSEQLERGLYGVLIVEDAVNKSYDRDIVWVIDDWLLMEDYQIYPSFVTMRDLMHDGRWGNVVTVNASIRPKLELSRGERIRLRVVNASNARIYRLYFAGLSAEVIAVDGMYVSSTFKPHEFALSPGNRLDIDIKAGEEDKLYQVIDGFSARRPYGFASIEVKGSGAVADKLKKDFPYPVNSRVPSWDSAYGTPVDQEYILNARRPSLEEINSGEDKPPLKWTLNDYAYPNYEGLDLEAGKFVKISFVNESSRLHPMHLHSQFFKVLERNGERANEPYFRDTVLVGPRERVVVGMIPFDKGLWPYHCHIQEHSDAGMLTLIRVR